MKRTRILLSTSLIIFTVSLASAAQLYWDPGLSDSGAAGGSGNWDTNDMFWFNGSTDIAWTNANNDDAYFSGTAGTVTLTNDIFAGDIYFTNVTGSFTNYTITNLTGVEVLNVANTIDTGGGDHTIGALLANSSTLNKNGDGTLHLPANNTNVTGSVMINQGAVSVENNNSLGNNNSITVAPGAALEFNGGTNVLSPVYNSITAAGTGVTNSGAIRNLSGGSSITANINLTGDTLFYSDNGRLSFAGGGYTITASGNNNLTAAGPGNVYIGSDSINLNSGSVIVETNSTLYMYVGGLNYNSYFANVVIDSNAVYYAENDNGFGTVPTATDPTNAIVDGGTLAAGGNYPMSATRGITVTANGGTISDTATSGTWTTGSIYSSNTTVTIYSAGTIHLAASAGTNILNLGTGGIIKTGSGDAGNSFNSTTAEVFSNLTVNAGSFTFNYDNSSGQISGLGALPSSLNPSNIVLNGGALHVGHSTTISANRGITLRSGGGTIQDVTSSATITISSPITGPGSINFPLGHSSSSQTVVLTGANTYTGATTVGNFITLTISGGSATLGTGNTTDNGNLTFARTGTYTYAGAISGSSNLFNTASGTVTLTGKQTYAGITSITAGTLLIDNTNGSKSVTVASGGTLGGTGIIGGPTSINAGGKLALGSTTLSFSNNLSIAGNVTVSVNKSLTPSSGMAIVSGTITRSGSGTLTVANAGPTLAPGDTFQIFNQAVSGAGTMAISGGGTGGYSVAWNNNLAVDGTISVQSVVPPRPVIKTVQVINGSIIISGSNGPDNGTCYVLTSTDLTLPLSQWTPISTNSFLSNGQISITIPITPGMPQQFYLLQAQ